MGLPGVRVNPQAAIAQLAQNLPLIALHLAGVALAFRIAPRPQARVLAFGSLWLGGFIWHILIYGFASLHIGPTISLWSSSILVAVTAWLLHGALRRHGWRPLLGSVLAGTVVYLIATIVATFQGSGFTYDSFQLVIQGLNWIETGSLGSAVAESKLLSWGPWISTLHAASHFTGTQYLSAAHPALAQQLALMLGAALWHESSEHTRPLWWAIVALTAAMVGGSAYLGYTVVYVHNNLSTAGFFFIACYVSVQMIRQPDLVPLDLTLAAWLMFGLQRMETIPLACIGVWFTLSYSESVPDAWRRIFLWITLPLTIWIGQRLVVEVPRKSVLGRATLMMYLLGVWLHPVVVHWSTANGTRKSNVARTTVLAALAFLAGMLLLRMPHMNLSLASMVTNVSPQSHWGPFWVVLGLLALATGIQQSNASIRFLGAIISLYLIYVMALAFLRLPYRTGFGDSGSRMLLHIVPPILLYLGLRIQQPDMDLRTGGIRLLRSILILAALLTLDTLALRRIHIHDITSQATVSAPNINPYQLQNVLLETGEATFDVTNPEIVFRWSSARHIDSAFLEVLFPGSVSNVIWYADSVSLPEGAAMDLTQLRLPHRRFVRGWYAFDLSQPVQELRLQFTQQAVPVTLLNLDIYDRRSKLRGVPRDYAPEATGFSTSSMRGNGIDLTPILSGQRTDTRSRKPGPVDAFVALPATIRGGHIEIDFYRPEEIPDHYSVSVSPDGRNWHNVYTCTPEACPPAAARVPATRQYLFDPERSYKYVRVAMQHAPGSGRLWLRKIRIFGYE